MTTLRVQADELSAAGEVADGQRTNLGQMDRYASDHLSRLEAFGGVLALFRGQYAAALESVHAGLRAEGARSGGLTDGFSTCRQEFADADQRSQALLDRVTTSVRLVAEAKLETEVTTVRTQGGPWAQVVEARDAIHGLTSSASAVRDSWHGLEAEVDELATTTDDLRSYSAFIDGNSA